MGSQAYELLQIESDQSPSPRRKSRKYLTWGFALTLAVLISVAAVSTAVAFLPVDKLEVQPDNSPAAKRGAGLLLTYEVALRFVFTNMQYLSLQSLTIFDLSSVTHTSQCLLASCTIERVDLLAAQAASCCCFCATASITTTHGACQVGTWKMKIQTCL
jgi:hypothetical protein